MITPRQHQLLVYIDKHSREDGYCPSMREMAAAIGLKSVGAVHDMLARLERRGFIRRLPRCSRSIEVIRVSP